MQRNGTLITMIVVLWRYEYFIYHFQNRFEFSCSILSYLVPSPRTTLIISAKRIYISLVGTYLLGCTTKPAFEYMYMNSQLQSWIRLSAKNRLSFQKNFKDHSEFSCRNHVTSSPKGLLFREIFFYGKKKLHIVSNYESKQHNLIHNSRVREEVGERFLN